MKLTARKAFTHPITSILSLCVVAGIAATLASFSQTSEPTVAPTIAIALTAQTMPVARTLTSADGRTIEVTILSKSDTAIKAKKADGKEFEIALDKLSDADKAFVAGLTSPPVKQLRVLLIGKDPTLQEKLKKAEFEIVGPSEYKEVTDKNGVKKSSTIIYLEKMTDADLKHFDVIWVTCWNSACYSLSNAKGESIKTVTDETTQTERLLKLLADGKLVVWECSFRTTKMNFIKNGGGDRVKNGFGYQQDKPYIKTQDNTIFYNWILEKWDAATGGTPLVSSNPEILDQVIIEVKKLILYPSKPLK
jgi:hypothetical protein